MDWKDKLSALVAEQPELSKAPAENAIVRENEEQPKQKKQTLRVELDKRKGKLATLITEYEGTEEEVKELAKKIKIKLGVGGSTRDGEILVQGDVRQKTADLLVEMGFKVKKINF